MKKIFDTLALAALLPASTAFAATIVFDTTPGGAGGTITYDGAGGPAIGADIKFVNISATGAPLNGNIVLDCLDCLLNFETGLNISEGSEYQWDGGGFFTLTGDVPLLGIVGETLLTGSFTASPNTPGLAALGNTGIFFGFGIDTKNETLAAFYGLDGLDWVFANTEIALGSFTSDASASLYR